jgi:hypothetical protein
LDKPTINIATKNGVDYATVYGPSQTNGISNKKLIYLGRVIDKDSGIYKNKTLGTYKYCLETGEFTPLNNYEPTSGPEQPSLIFGDVFVARQILANQGLLDLFGTTDLISPDTLITYVIFRTISSLDDAQALTWWEGTFAKVLCPAAQVDTRGLRDCLARVGEPDLQDDFFQRYLTQLFGGLKGSGLLVDCPEPTENLKFDFNGSPIPNALSGQIDRIIYVVDKKSRMPLFYKYIAGNIAYDKLLDGMLAQLKSYNITINLSILDSNYFSSESIEILYDNNIPFLMRLENNTPLFKQLVDFSADKLVNMKNMYIYNDSIFYIVYRKFDLFGHSAYAYIIIDSNRRQAETLRTVQSPRLEELSIDEQEEELKKCGLFLIISSAKLDPSEIPPRFYRKQAVEQTFELKNHTRRWLSLETEDDAALKGHLFISFLSSINSVTLQNKLKYIKMNNVDALHSMHYMFCRKFGDKFVIDRPTQKMKKILTTLGVKTPVFWPEL